MKLSSLKKLRVIISIFFFFFLSFLFLDYGNILSPAYTNYITYLQFIPSLIKFTGAAGIATAGFIIIILLTFSFGRIYCSSVCPLGTLQDIISFLSKKIHKKKHYKLSSPNNWLRYLFLLGSIIFSLSGSLFVINLLDPYSNFGRIFTQLLKPILLLLNNLLAFALERVNIYSFYPVEIPTQNFALILFPLAFLILVAWLSYKKGRLFCNTICPVGTLLGLISRYSIYKIKIDQQNCISCKLCERVCKAGCIDKQNKIVDFSRCVNCYNCFSVCATEGIKYSNTFMKPDEIKNKPLDNSKRKFIVNTFTYLAVLSGLAKAQTLIVPKKQSTIPEKISSPVSPPGSRSIEHFNDLCTACHLCVSACPTNVIQPSYLEYGFLGILQPRMDYRTNFCNFECIICSQVCPTGAISPVKLSNKKLLQLGKAKFIKDNCIVYTEKTECGACAEHCPTKAVTMVPYKNLKAPEVKEEYCIGCGACEFACPTKPYKAIFVDGNPVHQTAKKKEIKKLEQKVDYQEDFPF